MNVAIQAVRSVTCPYCNAPARLVMDSSAYYQGRDYGPLWVCDTCDARVGCHSGTVQPLGRLANAALRAAKIKAHRAFDPLWNELRDVYDTPRRKHHGIARNRAYRWLAEQLHIPIEECHIGMFDIPLCERAIQVIREREPSAASIRAWAKAQST